MKQLLERIGLGSIVVVLALIVIHAPLTVWLGTQAPAYEQLIKSWKELIIGVGLVALAIDLTLRRRWSMLARDWLFWAIIGYVALHFLLLLVHHTSPLATIAGLAIDLRYVAMFALVYSYLRLYPQHRRTLLTVIGGGAVLVVGFAVLQLVLPRDFLTVFGYGDTTIRPYLLVDQNEAFPRFGSTLRGPNPMGAYIGIVLAGVTAWSAARWRRSSKRDRAVVALLGIASLVALYISHSRSAWIAAALAMTIVVSVRSSGRTRRVGYAVAAGLVAAVLIGVVVFRDNPIVSKLVFHEDPAESGLVNSNDEHAASLVDGVERMIAQPIGAGIGSTGSASLLSDSPLIIENQYLFIAHEVGWAGFVLFGIIYGAVLHRLWLRRSRWLALAVFASGVGLFVIGLLLPVWADDTVSIVWWALAALVIADNSRRKS